jgi:hypothetical protein
VVSAEKKWREENPRLFTFSSILFHFIRNWILIFYTLSRKVLCPTFLRVLLKSSPGFSRPFLFSFFFEIVLVTKPR